MAREKSMQRASSSLKGGGERRRVKTETHHMPVSRTHTHTHAYTHAHTHTHTHTHTRTRTHTHTRTEAFPSGDMDEAKRQVTFRAQWERVMSRHTETAPIHNSLCVCACVCVCVCLDAELGRRTLHSPAGGERGGVHLGNFR